MKIKYRLIFFTGFILLPAMLFAGISEIEDLAKEISRDFAAKQKQVLFKKRLAILNFSNTTPRMKEHNIGETVSNLLTTEMAQSTIFTLIERENIDKVIKELELGMTGAVNPETAAKAGELSGAEYLLDGTVAEIGDGIVINCKLISTETGEIISARDVKIESETLIKTSEELYWSAFQSKYGIFVSIGGTGIITHGKVVMLMNVDVGYQFSRYFRAGFGFIRGGGPELITEIYPLVEGDSYWVLGPDIFPVGAGTHFELQRNYDITITAGKVFFDLMYPVFSWLNISLREEYIFTSGTGFSLIQRVHGFAVPDPAVADPANTAYIEKRVMVTGTTDAAHMINSMIMVEFLISKRLSLNIKGGYLVTWDYIPDHYITGDDERETGDIDNSGTFPQYDYFNFSRRENGDRVKINISGFTVSIGVSLHI